MRRKQIRARKQLPDPFLDWLPDWLPDWLFGRQAVSHLVAIAKNLAPMARWLVPCAQAELAGIRRVVLNRGAGADRRMQVLCWGFLPTIAGFAPHLAAFA